MNYQYQFYFLDQGTIRKYFKIITNIFKIFYKSIINFIIIKTIIHPINIHNYYYLLQYKYKIIYKIYIMDINLNTSVDKTTTSVSGSIDKVHIKVFKRNARKYITIVEGLDATFDLKAILKKLKKDVLFCNGKVAKDKETNELTLKLQGDQG